MQCMIMSSDAAKLPRQLNMLPAFIIKGAKAGIAAAPYLPTRRVQEIFPDSDSLSEG